MTSNQPSCVQRLLEERDKRRKKACNGLDRVRKAPFFIVFLPFDCRAPRARRRQGYYRVRRSRHDPLPKKKGYFTQWKGNLTKLVLYVAVATVAWQRLCTNDRTLMGEQGYSSSLFCPRQLQTKTKWAKLVHAVEASSFCKCTRTWTGSGVRVRIYASAAVCDPRTKKLRGSFTCSRILESKQEMCLLASLARLGAHGQLFLSSHCHPLTKKASKRREGCCTGKKSFGYEWASSTL